MLEKKSLYRLPWSLNDNPIAWLEVTDKCNIYCEGCYRRHLEGHKPLAQIKQEILFFKKWRNPDNVSIAGGEPLVHPQILDIISFIAKNGIKPIVLTNALALTPEVLKELKKAGTGGFTIHIDRFQSRPSWKGKTEKELNALRQRYADMIAEAGKMHVIFNSTVYPSTLQEVPDVVAWGQQNMGKVHGLVFITYRTGILGSVSGYDANGEEVDLAELSYTRESFEEKFVKSNDVYELIKSRFPEYEASCYLGGTSVHDSFKWLIGSVVGSKKKIFGSAGRRTMEVAQIGHHFAKGTYMAYISCANIGSRLFLMAPFDQVVNRTWRQWLSYTLRHPQRAFEGVHIQSIGIIQAPDILEDGRTDMCDSCPDMTVWNGRLINSCRMDEYRLYGGLLKLSPTAGTPKKEKVPEETKILSAKH